MGRYSWSQMNKLQVGRFAEYFTKMEFALYGFEIFTSEVDDRGIDFVVRYKSKDFLEIQVKSARDANYIYMQKTKFPLRPSRYLALVLLPEDLAPEIYLIPSTVWLTPNALFVDRDYEGLKSKPEWGVSLSGKTPGQTHTKSLQILGLGSSTWCSRRLFVFAWRCFLGLVVA
jgi:hypothetical protein